MDPERGDAILSLPGQQAIIFKLNGGFYRENPVYELHVRSRTPRFRP